MTAERDRISESPGSRKAWAGNSAYDAESLLAAPQATVRVHFETRRFLNFVAGFSNIIIGDYIRKCRNLSINAGSVAGLSI